MARHVCRLFGHRWVSMLVAAHRDWFKCRRCGMVHCRARA